MTVLKIMVVVLALGNVGYFLWNRGMADPQAADTGATLRLASEGVSQPQAAAAGSSGIAMADHDDPAHGVPPNLGAGSNATGDPGSKLGAGAGAGAGVGGAPGVGDAGEGTAALLTNVKRCVTVGPFRDVSEAARAASTLRGGGYDPRQRVADGEVWAGVWVYLPVPANHAARDQMLTKLKAAGIDDALEMPGPAEGSVISLGLFSEPKRAQARVVQAQALGLNPGIADRKRNGDVYWIDIDLKPTDALLKASDLQNEAHINRLEVNACPVAASP